MFKVGQTVWCVLFGKGEVVRANNKGRYLVDVKFESDATTRTYTDDGRYSDGYSRTLFFSEPKIEAATEPPFVSELIGKMVVLKDKDGDGSVILGTVFKEDSDSVTFANTGIYYKRYCSIHVVSDTPVYS